MKTVRLSFLWHMHQPYYTDPVTGSASMPWVRLHAAKAYFDMAYLLDRFPSVSATFNFTPSLLLQLEEVSAGTARDLFLDHAQRSAEELLPEEKAFLIRHFFSANWATMVRPYPRYHELLVKRGMDVYGRDLDRLARQFTTQELRDLQVWHNLAWFGYGAVHRYPRLASLRAKSRGFTEEDKQEVLTLQRAVIQEIVPLYRALADRGQIELTTTPFFHPILPLVIDTEINRRARPDLPLPARFHAPEDATAQLHRAVEFHAHTFGRAPVGLWPSEGSVCPELVAMLPSMGFRWLATDEGILARSLEASHQPWHRPGDLYQPYRFGSDAEQMTLVFRDRDISDAFGFVYHKTTPESAAEDVLRRLNGIVRDAPQRELLIAVVLDGENPWEHYHDGGERFLSLLYTHFAKDTVVADGSAQVQTATVSQALEAVPPSRRLSHLHSGSWINQDYKIWIGHQEDNRAWDLLSHTRSCLVELTPGLPPDRARVAWDELYAAEGSDWFWWYGDDFDTDYKQEFDRLFRTHLRNVWILTGAAPPAILNEPIAAAARPIDLDRVSLPVALIDPTVDGLVTNFFEWRGAGTIEPRPPLGAMWKAERILSALYFGWSLDRFFIRLDPDEPSRAKQEEVSVEIHLQRANERYRLAFPFASPDRYDLCPVDSASRQECRSIARQKIIELAVAFKDVHAEPGQELRFCIVMMAHGLEIARYPQHHPVAITVPGPEFEATMWRV